MAFTHPPSATTITWPVIFTTALLWLHPAPHSSGQRVPTFVAGLCWSRFSRLGVTWNLLSLGNAGNNVYKRIMTKWASDIILFGHCVRSVGCSITAASFCSLSNTTFGWFSTFLFIWSPDLLFSHLYSGVSCPHSVQIFVRLILHACAATMCWTVSEASLHTLHLRPCLLLGKADSCFYWPGV